MFDQLKLKSVQLILLATLLTYVPALTNNFTNWDDNTHIVLNDTIQSSDPAVFKKIFTTTILETYIPLTLLSFSIEYHLFKLNPFVYHLNNILLHLLVVYLIYLFFLRLKLSQTTAILMALIFGVHPIHVESIAWITERKDVLYTSFYLFALHSYLDYIETKKIKTYLKVIAFGVLSILSKPAGLTLPLVLWAIDWFTQRRDFKNIILEKIPFFAYVIPVSLITIIPNRVILLFYFDPIHTICVFFWSLSFYLSKFFYPLDLIPAYSVPTPISLFNPIYIFSVLICMVWFYVCFKLRRNRLFIFGNLIFILTLFYVFRLAYHPLNKGMVADRFIYLPSFGLLIALGSLIETLPKFQINRTLTKNVLLAIAFLLSMKTITQCSVWKDSLTLWNYVIKKEPNLYFAYNNRATAFTDFKEYDLALADYSTAVILKKDYPLIYSNRVTLYRELKRYDDALKDLDTLLELKNNLASVYFNRAAIFIDQKKLEEAIIDLTKCIEDLTKSKKDDPHLHDSYMFRALAYKEIKETLKSIEDFKQAALLNPKNFNTYFLLSEAYKEINQYNLAIENLNKAIHIDPNTPIAYVVRARSYEKLGDYTSALNDALTAQSIGYPRLEQYIAKIKGLIVQQGK